MTRCPECQSCECSKADLADYDDEESRAAWADAAWSCTEAQVSLWRERSMSAEAKLKALAGLVERWPTCPHWQDCATLNRGGDCTCGAVEADLARAEARRLLEGK